MGIRKAVGMLVFLWALGQFFGGVLPSAERAIVATFDAVTVAAIISESRMETLR